MAFQRRSGARLVIRRLAQQKRSECTPAETGEGGGIRTLVTMPDPQKLGGIQPDQNLEDLLVIYSACRLKNNVAFVFLYDTNAT